MSDIAALILAAGKSTRMKSKHPKAVHPLMGKPMSQYIIDACRDGGASRIVVIVGHKADEVKATLGSSVVCSPGAATRKRSCCDSGRGSTG
jgi:bifunctional UDP-N-acetylglucosamine pyrophosphorylase/glucosamine-1-phosphate N-acetyltransferase